MKNLNAEISLPRNRYPLDIFNKKRVRKDLRNARFGAALFKYRSIYVSYLSMYLSSYLHRANRNYFSCEIK